MKRPTAVYTKAQQVENEDDTPDHVQKYSWPEGWRGGLLLGVIFTFLVLSVNLGTTMWVLGKFGLGDGIPTIYEAKCAYIKRTSLWIHLAINVFGTALLGASNYTTQILVAPTRRDIDKAHERFDWLNIGVPGFRNLWRGRIGRHRVWMWWFLMLSSVPLHLLWVLSVFTTRASAF
jgi:hypothetical protein